MAKLAVLILVAAILAVTSNGDSLVVKTANEALSGTEALVAFEFYDPHGGPGSIRLVDGDGSAMFNEGSTDTLVFDDDLSVETCRLGLRLLDTSIVDKEWKCEYVQLSINSQPSGQSEPKDESDTGPEHTEEFNGVKTTKFLVNQWVRPGKRVLIDLCAAS